VHVQAKGLSFDGQGGDRHTDFRHAMTIIHASGYRGLLGIEYEGPGDGLQGCRKTLRLVRRHDRPVGPVIDS